MSGAVRTLRPHDSTTATALYAACFDAPWERVWTADEFAGLLSSPGCFGVMLMVGDQPCGFAVACVAADEAELLTLGVVPSARRHGAASLLLSTVRRRCRRRGARCLFLEVSEDNLPARRLYEAHGFITVGRRYKYFDRGPNGRAAALVLRRDFVTMTK